MPPTAVIHAASTGTSPQPDCGGGAPQGPCSLDDALTLAAADPTNKAIKLDDAGLFEPISASYNVNANIAIEAGAAIFRGGAPTSALFVVTNGKSLTLIGGELDESNGDSIQCSANSALLIQGTTIQNSRQSAINASSCSVTIAHAIIEGSLGNMGPAAIIINGGKAAIYQSTLIQNRGGAIDVHGGATFQIVGNVLQNNGNSTTSAISISTSENSLNRLEFNTISANRSSNSSTVSCIAGMFTARNNIVWDNTGTQIGGTCAHAFSIIGPTPTLPTGTDGGHNTSADPLLISETSNPHIQAGSSAIGRADPAADLTGIAAKDIDGDTRKSPADCGADQLP